MGNCRLAENQTFYAGYCKKEEKEMESKEEKQYDLTYITRDAEGCYRWTYFMDSSTNKSFLNLYLLIFALIILIPGAIMFFLICVKNDWVGAGPYLLIWLGVFAGVELLTYLVYKGIEKLKGGETDIPYLMTDEFIVVHPGNEWTPGSYLRTDFSSVRDISLDLNSDLILLHELMRVTHVYVPREDLPFVLNFILDRVPQNGKAEALRKEVQFLRYD